MKRQTFLHKIATASVLLASPFHAIARLHAFQRITKALKVDAGKDRHGKPISLFEGDTFYTKVSSKDSDSDVYVFESVRFKEGGPSYHYHYTQDEFWYVLKGEFLFKVGDEEFRAKAGDTVFGPRMVPHTFSKIGEGEARLLMFFQPAGKMEEMFQKISTGITKGMTEEQQEQFRHEHGLKKVGPALQHFKNW
jgi:mannose-6-phosphate isomerase-like protein (cupin superfamily)